MDPREKKLLKAFKTLNESQRELLLEYVEFLLQRQPPERSPVPAEPLPIPRPQKETVVGAMKRLSATYPMVDTGTLLNEASSLMAQHLLQGREVGEVIDELEELFAQRFAAVSRET